MKRLIALLSVFVLCMLPGHALMADFDELGELIDRELIRYDTLGACVVIFQNGEITYTHTYGVTAPGGMAITEETGFQVASIGKLVANIGLMKLLDEKGLTLETELGDVLGYPIRNPNHPNTRITLRQLMTHTASLKDNGYYQAALYGDVRPLSELFSGNRLRFTFYGDIEPGTARVYSNFGGGIIGSLIEKLSGQTLDDYLTGQVFAPLGITAAYQASRLPEDMPLASMYYMPEKRLAKELRADDTSVVEPDAEQNYFLTGGKLIITASDLAKIMIALCDGGVYQSTRIIKESTAISMRTVQNAIGSVTCNSENGLFMNIITDYQVQGRTMYGHGGKANGMLCAAYFDPTDRTGVIMLTNGCNYKSVYHGVGMLGRMVMRVCYQQYLNPAHVPEDPFLVTE